MFKRLYFVSDFQEFGFLLPHWKTYLDNSRGHLPSLLSQNSPKFRHLFTGLQHSQSDRFNNIQFSCIPWSDAFLMWDKYHQHFLPHFTTCMIK